MKTLLTLMLLFSFAAPCFAGPCDDTQSAASAAINERNSRVKDSHNVLLPDPELERGPLSDCLSSINSIGDAFTLGVKLPGMDQIIAGMCNQVNSMIQQKINESLNKIHNTVSDIGKNNPFKVYGTGGDYVIKMTGKIQ